MNNKSNIIIKISSFLILMLLICIGMQFQVKAAEKASFPKKSYTMYEGNVQHVPVSYKGYDDYCNSWDILFYGEYVKSSKPSVLMVNEVGDFIAVATGKATVSFCDAEGNVLAKTTVTVKSGKCTISKDKVTIYEGESEVLRLKSSKHKAVSYEYSVIDAETMKGCYNALDVFVDEAGKYTFSAKKPGKYYVDFALMTAEGKRFSKRGVINVKPCGLAKYNYAVAKDDTIELEFLNAKFDSVSVNYWYDSNGNWISYEDDEHLMPIIIDEDSCSITGFAKGETHLWLSYKTPLDKLVQKELVVYTTTPEYTPFDGYLWSGESFMLNITNASRYSEYDITVSNDKIAEAVVTDDGITIIPKKTGKCKLYITVDGVEFEDTINVLNTSVPNQTVILREGESYQCDISVPEDIKVKYSSSNEKVAKVSKTGLIVAKGLGNTIITIKLLDREFAFLLTVGSDMGIKAAEYAMDKVGKASYSQEKRMQEGYYDCSSLCWRSYASAGVYLGDSKSYAPSSADLGKSLKDKGCVIATDGDFDIMNVLPGDLIFSSRGNNGRYLNIDHVAIYSGSELVTLSADDYWFYEMYGIEIPENGLDGYTLSGTMVHAGSGGGGFYLGGYPSFGVTKLIARPSLKY